MNKVLKVLVLLPALFFIVTGFRWLFAPATCLPKAPANFDPRGAGIALPRRRKRSASGPPIQHLLPELNGSRTNYTV
jgi:hypothetical protein